MTLHSPLYWLVVVAILAAVAYAQQVILAQQAIHVFERLKADPILKGEWGMIEGERVPIQPYRQRLDEKIKEVQQLAAGCPAIPKNGRP
jgi:hypothetical protein